MTLKIHFDLVNTSSLKNQIFDFFLKIETFKPFCQYTNIKLFSLSYNLYEGNTVKYIYLYLIFRSNPFRDRNKIDGQAEKFAHVYIKINQFSYSVSDMGVAYLFRWRAMIGERFLGYFCQLFLTNAVLRQSNLIWTLSAPLLDCLVQPILNIVRIDIWKHFWGILLLVLKFVRSSYLLSLYLPHWHSNIIADCLVCRVYSQG